MYYAELTLQPWDKMPSEKWIKAKLFSEILEESDLMNQLLEGNKIVTELDFDEDNNKYLMSMRLTYTKENNILFDTYRGISAIDKDYSNYLKWDKKSKWKKLTTLIFGGFKGTKIR